MVRTPTVFVVALASLVAGSACSRQSAGPKPKPGAAYFWFDSRKISDAGNSFYGAYVYEQLLPSFAPGKRAAGASYAFSDGDYLPTGPVTVPANGAEEQRIVREAVALGGIAYIVAIYGYEDGSFTDVDRALKSANVTGYLGMSTTPGVTIDEYLALREALSLPVAFKLEGTKIRKAEFGFLGDGQLRDMGFEPQ